MFSTRWFKESVISDTRKTIKNTVERLRYDQVRQEEKRNASANSGGGDNAAAGASGKAKTANARKA